MRPALQLIARLYAVEERANALSLSAEQRMALRGRKLGRGQDGLVNLLGGLTTDRGAAVQKHLRIW